MPLLIKDLSEFVGQWNTHPIRNNNLADCPGVPVDMYEMLEELVSYSDILQVLDSSHDVYN